MAVVANIGRAEPGVVARKDDTERDEEIWRAIRSSQESAKMSQDAASQALREIAVHQATCGGIYKVIETKLSAILWLLGGIASAAGAGAIALVIKAFALK